MAGRAGTPMRVCLAPFRMFWFQAGWAYINWALGLQANGCKLYLLETLGKQGDPQEALRSARQSRANLQAIGVEADFAFLWTKEQREGLRPVLGELLEFGAPLEDVADECDLLVNFYYSLRADLVRRFPRAALIDIDPGLLQIWVGEGQMEMAPHDIYFTIGETVGRPDAGFSDCGVSWHFTPPVVHLPAWPVVPAAGSAPYTTITNWWSGYEEFRGEIFNNEKRTTFLEYVDLPRLTPVPLELSIFLNDEPINDQEQRNLREKGWRVRPAQDLNHSPHYYRSYIQQSRGEFSCAKPSCMRLQNAWISDRTLCYLASGKPAIVQHTGPSAYLPGADGLFRFRSMEEAVRALETIEADYERQSRNARALAEEHFDAEKVTRKMLERAMSLPARREERSGGRRDG
jgi:hypothetical protein